MASDSDSQVPIFLERLRSLFRASEDMEPRDEDPHRGMAIAVCVVLSFVLWASLTLQEQRMVTVSFPVEVDGIPAEKALTERPPSSVDVQLQGTGMDLLRLVFNPPTVGASAEKESINVAEALSIPRANDARVQSVTPQSIDVTLEPRMERDIPVRPQLNIRMASAYERIRPPRVVPGSISVSGAASVVSELAGWSTDSLTLSNVQDTVQTSVPLQDTLTGLVERSTDAVTVTVPAGKFAEETREVTVEVTGVPAGQDLVDLQPSTIRVRYRVLFEQLFDSRRSSEFFATVSYSQIRSDTTGYVTPRIHVPADLVIRDPEPIPPRLQYYTFLSAN
ncbi:MAG: YbbR-like domain-containing protein [Bacteroidetes bacterium SW_9_63_38]|nr:MAG: YbbR-like domain-containing protein [Bacteroidetes bacterium SW_9_63_38]